MVYIRIFIRIGDERFGDKQQLARFVKDYIDDEDAYPGMPFMRYFADLIGSGTNVPWDDVL